jgi:1-deoxy-D-xylulose-5-phosphate synthase
MSNLLNTIDSPADLKKIPIPQLPQLAQEIRDKLIHDLSKTGGHLGPNLGVVELTIALHYVFNTPTDNFVFDVSHQAYVHKLLTGRRDRFHTIRQAGGLNGFMLRTESEHDCYGAGHAGTALSAALGMAAGRDQKGTHEHVIALCGDAAFTCGITFEALNNIAHHTRRLIIILNDNEWSIDKNVGAIANYFNRIATHPGVSSLHNRARKFLERIGGKLAVRALHKAEEAVKGMVFPSLLFEELGVTYYGPVDGHDIPTLIKTFEFLKEQDYPVLLHTLTTKSKGFEPAQKKQKKFHGLGPFDPNTGETTASGQPTYSEIFADTLVRLAEQDSRIIAITGAMPNGTALDRFSPKHPTKYYDVGIAEEHAVLFAAGLATKGLKPFCAIYSTFLQRAFDPIVHDVCLQNLNVAFCMDRSGLSGDDGPTHHGLFDIAYLRGIPNIVLMAPKDEEEFADMLATAAAYNGPIGVRYPRGIGPGAKPKETLTPLPIGKAEVIHEGTDVAIFALGDLFGMGGLTRLELEKQGYSTALINPRFIKPLDLEILERYARSTRLIITFEDHVLANGFGCAILEAISNLGLSTPVVRIGWPDQFIEHGKVPALREKYGISVAAAIEKAIPILQKR